MIINGVTIPDWIVRNNTTEQIKKYMNADVAKISKPAFDDDIDLDDKSFGVLAKTSQGLSIIKIGISEDQAIKFASDISAQNINIQLFIFDYIPFDYYLEN